MMTGRQRVGGMEFVPFAGREVETENVLRADALGPDLAVDVVAQTDEVELYAVVVPFRRQRIVFDGAGLRIDGAERALIHHVEPQHAFLVEGEAELADRRAGFEILKRIFGELERLRIEFRNIKLAEIRVPDIAVLIEDDVVRL